MERNLRRQKNTPSPKSYTTAAEIRDAFKLPATMNEYGMNLRNTRPFYIDTIEIEKTPKPSAFTLFVSHQVIDMIRQKIPPNQRNILMDGTFSSRPIGCFYQLLVMYIEYKNDVSIFLFMRFNI